MKALDIMNKAKSIADRAARFASSIKRDLQVKLLDSLKKEIETIEDRIFELSDMSLATDLNKGQRQMTQEECQKCFEELINLEYNLEMTKMKLKIKQTAFDKYFAEDEDLAPKISGARSKKLKS